MNGDGEERVYTVLYEDGDVEVGLTRSRIVFLGRYSESEITSEMKESIANAVRISEKLSVDEDDDVVYMGSILDLTHTNDIADPERGEITGHTDTC